MEYFQTKNTDLGTFWRVLLRKIMCPFGILYGYLVHCLAIWYILWLLGAFSPVLVLCEEKSGNPGLHIVPLTNSNERSNGIGRLPPFPGFWTDACVVNLINHFFIFVVHQKTQNLRQPIYFLFIRLFEESPPIQRLDIKSVLKFEIPNSFEKKSFFIQKKNLRTWAMDYFVKGLHLQV
jgi:hypothetical protein